MSLAVVVGGGWDANREITTPSASGAAADIVEAVVAAADAATSAVATAAADVVAIGEAKEGET